MAYLESTATDRADLLDDFLTFLAAHGWTRAGSEITNSAGTTFAFDVAVAIAARALYPTGTVNDGSFGVKIKTDSFGVAGYSAIKYSNDFTGPFPVTYYFTDGLTAHCVVKNSSVRYAHLSFGHLDTHDLHSFDVPFIAAMYYEWWWRQANYTSDSDSGFNYVQSDHHGIGHFGEDGQCLALLPAWHNTCHHYAFASPASSDLSGDRYILDFFTGVQNQSMTGGIPLHTLPMIADPGTQICYIGDLSNIRLVNILGLSPAQVVSYAGDDWVVFPLKQQGDINSQCFGATPLPVCNTGYYGLAYKK
jgi:hypothetical protein